MREILEQMDGYAVVLTPFHIMEEPDWIVLRLLRELTVRTRVNTPDMEKAIEYLEAKYPREDIHKAYQLLVEEQTNA